MATDNNDFSKKWYDAVAYGIIFSGVTYILFLIPKHITLNYIIVVLGLVIAPIFTPLLLRRMRNVKWIRDHTLRPEATAWDYVFSSRKPYWVILHMKDGKDIGGVYADKSFTSAYPYKQDIYLEELWRLDSDNKFKEQIKGSAGIWVSVEDVSSIEFFKYGEE